MYVGGEGGTSADLGLTPMGIWVLSTKIKLINVISPVVASSRQAWRQVHQVGVRWVRPNGDRKGDTERDILLLL